MQRRVLVIGAGPAGLIAAERVADAGHAVTVIDRMPSPGRKFLLAGRGGLNLTHSEAMPGFLARYGSGGAFLAPLITRFSPANLTRFAEELGEPTFIGSSGRVFPRSFKASPLLRAWLRRLDARGVAFRFSETWTGFAPDGAVLLLNHAGEAREEPADATVLALGGASWPRMGSDGGWVGTLVAAGVSVKPLRPANMGFDVPWTPFLRDRHAGRPLKAIAVSSGGESARGEAMITESGIEGGVIYALSGSLREAILANGFAELVVDLRPDESAETLAAKLARAPRKLSTGNRLRRALALDPEGIALMNETDRALGNRDDASLAALVKAVPLALTGFRSLERAISTAGGIALDELDENLMLKRLPGVFAAGEMLDWDAPTGGYLLQACFSTGAAAADGAIAWLQRSART
jgi:uncharacterized flavoprotein (TIGR03862 family)